MAAVDLHRITGMDTSQQELMQLFFVDQKLSTLISYFCKITVGQSSDPIAETIVAMISSPVVLMLTQVGIAPFREHPSYVYPYRFLDEEQREFLRRFVTSTADNAAGSIASTQVGGGCMLYKKPQSKPMYLDTYNVIAALCDGIVGSRTGVDKKFRLAVCSVVLQRIGGIVHIDRAVMSKIALHLQGFTESQLL